MSENKLQDKQHTDTKHKHTLLYKHSSTQNSLKINKRQTQEKKMQKIIEIFRPYFLLYVQFS